MGQMVFEPQKSGIFAKIVMDNFVWPGSIGRPSILNKNRKAFIFIIFSEKNLENDLFLQFLFEFD